jgi:hypothetical protein
MSGRVHGPRYATIASVSSAAWERFRCAGRSNRRAHAAASSRPARNAQPPATYSSTIPLAHQAQRVLDPLRVVVCSIGKLRDRKRRRGDDEQRLERPRELV